VDAARLSTAPDWKTLYVPVEKITVEKIDIDGKEHVRRKHFGEIRAWDTQTGKELEPLPAAVGCGPTYANLAPGGGTLITTERASAIVPGPDPYGVTIAWDLATRKARKLSGDFLIPSFAPDGKTIAAVAEKYEEKTQRNRSTALILEVPTGKELARLECPAKDRFFSIGPIAPDGQVVAIHLGGKKGAPVEVWFRDARTLADCGKLIGKPDPTRYGWGSAGLFTGDGKRFIVLDGEGNLLVWDVAAQKIAASIVVHGAPDKTPPWGRLVLSGDSKTIAVAWVPSPDRLDDPQPREVQPHISVMDLTGKSPARRLIAPLGHIGGLAFSPDGKTLAFGSSGVVHLFDLR
jgi:WD40 repeat protein